MISVTYEENDSMIVFTLTDPNRQPGVQHVGIAKDPKWSEHQRELVIGWTLKFARAVADIEKQSAKACILQ